ncbi:2-C-methyl-D-erythritol 4-phosphate cytidylyltransferase [Pedobacter faecalis]|uniref:2-C-methyl-D-erythritol 4-phosphate cytidylyltransferase n=1 Tax=Pedobacter faecalis TaxID=3041495 RepID=UPI00254F0801|nr:2-C-methyl-D-erythritol 4-phosphate cytidylyltransferase [Pedobacter sp. ELA7]
MKYFAIIVAGGSGSRMQSKVAKQFLLLRGRPVMMYTIQAFYKCTLSPEIIVVLNRHQHHYWAELCRLHHFDIPHKVVEGGETRFHSVKNGLAHILEQGVVAIHDAVRPLVSPELILRSYKQAEKKGNCVVAVSPTDSLRKLDEAEGSLAVNRNDFILVQTPQTFIVETHKDCYNIPYEEKFTDDATVAEHCGHAIHIAEGERENIKITYPEDLEIADIYLKKRGF